MWGTDETDPERNHSSLSPSTILICSAASKMIASLATYPHEVLRTRLQIAKAHSITSPPTTSSTPSQSSRPTPTPSRSPLYSPLVTGSNPPLPLPLAEPLNIPRIAANPSQLAEPVTAISRWRKGGIVETALKIKRQDGWRGFYRGLSINLVRTVPNSAVTMLS